MQRILLKLLRAHSYCGNISAHAENTKSLGMPIRISEKHLCACREYIGGLLALGSGLETSLRMQRIQSSRCSFDWMGRNISAHAENTIGYFMMLSCFRKHLCACREYVSLTPLAIRYVETSLRMQRIQLLLIDSFESFRNISAHAENTEFLFGMMSL